MNPLQHLRKNNPIRDMRLGIKQPISRRINTSIPEYKICANGSIKSLSKDRILPYRLGGFGYFFTTLIVDGKPIIFKIHELIVKKYLPNPYMYTKIKHINGFLIDNDVDNLQWIPTEEYKYPTKIKEIWLTFPYAEYTRISNYGRIQELGKPIINNGYKDYILFSETVNKLFQSKEIPLWIKKNGK